MANQHIPPAAPAELRSEDAFLEKFHPAPLSALVAWLFRPREQAKDGQDSFDEHINGLA